MISFADRYAAHVRLAILLSLVEVPQEDDVRLGILRLLAGAPQGTSTQSLVRDALEDFDHRLTRDEIAAVSAWLVRAGLVRIPAGPVPAVMLLDLGRDVADGRVPVPGVAPLPTEEWMLDRLAHVSLPVAHTDLDGHLDHLAEAGCLRRRDGLVLITRKGRDVAVGRDQVDGVKAPSASTIMAAASAGARARLEG